MVEKNVKIRERERKKTLNRESTFIGWSLVRKRHESQEEQVTSNKYSSNMSLNHMWSDKNSYTWIRHPPVNFFKNIPTNAKEPITKSHNST